MLKKDVQVGATYVVKVSGKTAGVKIVAEHHLGGWLGRNIATGRDIRVRTAARLRRLVSPPKNPENN